MATSCGFPRMVAEEKNMMRHFRIRPVGEGMAIYASPELAKHMAPFVSSPSKRGDWRVFPFLTDDRLDLAEIAHQALAKMEAIKKQN